jgi:diadenosine tetraphosphate (Ap4A) HIT family hydrolase
MNATAEKFGYPHSLLSKFEFWSVLLRPAQVTLGSLVLVCHEPVAHFGEISGPASRELGIAVAAIESALGQAFAFDRINYLMLMMVDPDVHFHVLPRYEAAREFAGMAYRDDAWPGPPDVTSKLTIGEDDLATLREHLRTFF